METTRHLTATVYPVRDGAVPLHHHERADAWLPPGGHVDRDELPRVTARREVREETGLSVTLRTPATEVAGAGVEERPPPEHLLLVDVHEYADGSPAHQHLDMVYYGRLAAGELAPADDGLTAADWVWFDEAALRSDDRPDDHVAAMARDAIATVGATP